MRRGGELLLVRVDVMCMTVSGRNYSVMEFDCILRQWSTEHSLKAELIHTVYIKMHEHLTLASMQGSVLSKVPEWNNPCRTTTNVD